MNLRNFWFEGKAWIVENAGMSQETLHVHLGLAVFFALALLFRRLRYRLLWAWLGLLLVQLANEAMDARDWINWTGTINWAETFKDTLATMFWPSVVCLVFARHRLPRDE